MINYLEFNYQIFNYYVTKTASTFFSFTVDKSEIENIVAVDQLKNFHILKTSWDCLLQTNEIIPLYFGLIAIQTYAASLMQDDGEYSAENYQVRLCEVLGLKEYNELQVLFRGNNRGNPVQEEIWYSAKEFLKRQFNLDLTIPSRTSGRGRYVQFPRSQALLNTEDLKPFTVFYHEEFNIKEQISFHYFRSKLLATLPNIRLSNRAKALLDQWNKKEECIKQVYNNFINWEGHVFSLEKSKGVVRGRSYVHNEARQPGELLLVKYDGVLSAYLLEEQNVEIPLPQVFTIPNYRYWNRKFLFFTQSLYNSNEYEESRFLFVNKPAYVVANKLSGDELVYLERNAIETIKIDENVSIFIVLFEDKFDNNPLKKYFQLPHPIELKSGLRLSRSNEYLKGFGPTITSSNSFKVLYNHTSCVYNPRTAEEGEYKVRTEFFQDVLFYIKKLESNFPLVKTKEKAWNFRNYALESSGHLEGCMLLQESVPESEQEPIVRKWINANFSGKITNKHIEKNILIKALISTSI